MTPVTLEIANIRCRKLECNNRTTEFHPPEFWPPKIQNWLAGLWICTCACMLDQRSIPSIPSLIKLGARGFGQQIRWISTSWHLDVLLTFAQQSGLILCCCTAWPEHLQGWDNITAKIFNKNLNCYDLTVTLILTTLGKSCSFLCVTSRCVRWPEL